jgi:uncharacterized protein (DUF2267 family)
MSQPLIDAYADDDTTRHERFITTIQQRAGVSWPEAERAAKATLATLSERISSGAAGNLAQHLPRDAARWLDPRGDAQSFDAVEFVRRVAEREGTDPATAERHARAVFVALARLVREDEIARVVAELPKDYDPLLADGDDATVGRRDPTAAPEPRPVDVIVERVGGHAGLDRRGARAALEAVLEALAERVAGGEVDDLAAALPDELRQPLERGRARTGGKAQRMSIDEFIARVAEREGVTDDAARDHVQAVFTTLREVIPDKEWSDLLAELPRAYAEVLT